MLNPTCVRCLVAGLLTLAAGGWPARAAARARPGAARFLISVYGAKGDAQTLNTTAIQAAIGACAAAGGGLVVVSAGTFRTGVWGTTTAVGNFHGLPGSPISEVRFRRCRIQAQRGLMLAHTRRVDVSGLHLTVAEGPALLRQEDVQ